MTTERTNPDPEGFELRVYFAGLCVFSPRRTAEQEIDGMTVLLVTPPEDAPPPQPGRRSLPDTSHAAAVQFALRNRFSDEPRYPLVTGRHGDLFGLWFLDGEDLRIRIPPTFERALPESEFALDERPVAGTPTPQNATSFHWVVPLTDGHGGVAQLRDEVVNPKKNPPPAVAARLFLDRGALRPAGFALDDSGERFRVWDMGNGGEPQAVVSVMEHRQWIPGRRVQIEARSSGDLGSRPRYLTLQAAPGQRSVEIWMMSLERNEIERQAPPQPPETDRVYRRWQEELTTIRQLALPGGSLPEMRPRPRGGGQGLVRPAVVLPCDNHSMRQLFFPVVAGQLASASGCSPIRTGP